MDPIWLQIHEAVHRLDTKLVGQLIPKYLKTHRSSPEATYEASEFYRKIMDYANALRVLPKERAVGTVSKSSDIETKLELQQARILNLLGASNYALRMIGRIRSENRAKSKIEMAEIYHCNCKFQEVLDLLGLDFPLPKAEPWHQDWLLHIYYAYALNGLKQREPAIARLDGIRTISKSPLIQAMAICYKGQFLIEEGFPENALPLLLESKSFFEGREETSDHGVLQKWLGICFFKLGRFAEADDALRRAYRIFFQPSMKAEDWMEIVLWMDQIPGARRSSERLAPRLSAMAGPSYYPLTEVGVDTLKDRGQIFSITGIEFERKKRHIDRESEMVWDGKKAQLRLDLGDELIWNLIYAGEFGLPQFRLYELLWPDEPFSFEQHQKRLENLVIRARARGYKIAWKSMHLRLLSADVTATGRPERVIRGYSFLIEHAEFTRNDVQNRLGVSRTLAAELCRSWLNAGLITNRVSARYLTVI